MSNIKFTANTPDRSNVTLPDTPPPFLIAKILDPNFAIGTLNHPNANPAQCAGFLTSFKFKGLSASA